MTIAIDGPRFGEELLAAGLEGRLNGVVWHDDGRVQGLENLSEEDRESFERTLERHDPRAPRTDPAPPPLEKLAKFLRDNPDVASLLENATRK